MAKPIEAQVVAIEGIANSIHVVRGYPVLLDVDLAALYGVETKVLLQAVKRNMGRFPEDFLLQLTADEWKSLRSQVVTSNLQHGGRRYTPYAFSEQGVAMLSSVLNSSRAIAVNIEIMRTFVRIRGGSLPDDELTKVKRRVESHETVLVRAMKSISNLEALRQEPPKDEER